MAPVAHKKNLNGSFLATASVSRKLLAKLKSVIWKAKKVCVRVFIVVGEIPRYKINLTTTNN